MIFPKNWRNRSESFKAFGLRHKDTSGKLLRFDDPRFDAIWTKCGGARDAGMAPRR